MTHKYLQPGDAFPTITVPKLGVGTLTLGKPGGDHDWQLVVIYRGKHCPLCTRYLQQLNKQLPALNQLGIDVIAVSADSAERAKSQIDQVGPEYSIGHDLSIEQMRQLGLFISDPRSPDESDRPFAEPGLYVINAEGRVQILDVSNAPFTRPELESLVSGLRFVRNPENNYPIRGTHDGH